MWIAMIAVWQTYYFAWNHAERVDKIWYTGFDGFDENTVEPLDWEQSDNIDMIQFEMAPN